MRACLWQTDSRPEGCWLSLQAQQLDTNLAGMLLGLSGLCDVLLGDGPREVSNAHDAHALCLQLLNSL